MKAFILAAGYGTRLRPLTDKIPKPLVSVWGKPVISYIIESLIEFGINDFVLNLHHLGDLIEEYLALKYKGVKFFYSREEKILDTGGGLKRALRFLKDDEFIMHNGDILAKFNFSEIVNYHKSFKNVVTIPLLERESSRKLCFDEDMCLCGWINREKNLYKGRIENVKMFSFAGFHVINPVIAEFMPEEDVFGIFDFYLSVSEKIKIRGFLIKPDYWYDIGSIDKLISIRKNPLF